MRRTVIGILAHVDAGKTTLSEAALYRTGVVRSPGRVDHADAFLDTDAMERERGITIFSKQAVFTIGENPEEQKNSRSGKKPSIDGDKPFSLPNGVEPLAVTLLDTPGHADFSAETERTLRVLDCAVLVVSASDGVQAHTRTLWRLLERNAVSAFLFVNKMDLPDTDRSALLGELRRQLDSRCVDFGAEPDALAEELALCDETVLERYLETGEVPAADVGKLVQERKLFPCFFGSALKIEGVDDFLEGLARYAPASPWPPLPGARIFKVTRDTKGERLTWLKVTGGALRVRDTLSHRRREADSGQTAAVRQPPSDGQVTNAGPSGDTAYDWQEKIAQIRVYSGEKFTTQDAVPAGTVCAVTGLSRARAGEGVGFEPDWEGPALEPVLLYRVIPGEGTDLHTVYETLRQLEEEDPQLHVSLHGQTLTVRLMGEVQLEILQRVLRERFSLDVSFDDGGIVYRETIAAPVEGVGHFEPLRHYAEVRLLLEPLPRGSGLILGTRLSTDRLETHWQRLILTHLAEREHPGVLTGSPVTDMRISLTGGRAHVKHTEGGDFREATYRAVRQGLMSAESVLLEPWYDFRLELPTPQTGRALTDLQRMNGEVNPPETAGDETVLTGSAPVSALRNYGREVAVYTRGAGRLHCQTAGFCPCARQDEVVAELGYDPDRDVDNPSGSVFCAHGAGYVVPWNLVPELAHTEGVPVEEDASEEEEQTSGPDVGSSGQNSGFPKPDGGSPSQRPGSAGQGGSPRLDYAGTVAQDKELKAIFERTYGPAKERRQAQIREKPTAKPVAKPPARDAAKSSVRSAEQADKAAVDAARSGSVTLSTGPEYLLVDGYNIIYAWEELTAMAREHLDAARTALCDLLCEYQGVRRCVVIAVFDAYKVKGNPGSHEKYHNIDVVYTKEAETADAYIERATYEIHREDKRRRVRVATSDGPEQLIILGHGALRVSATAFRDEMEQVQGQISAALEKLNRPQRTGAVRAAMEAALGRRDGDG